MEPDDSRKRRATASRTTTWTCRMDSHHRDHCPQEAAGHPTGAAGPGSSSYPAVDWAARSPADARGCGAVHGRVHGSKRIPPTRRPDPRGRGGGGDGHAATGRAAPSACADLSRSSPTDASPAPTMGSATRWPAPGRRTAAQGRHASFGARPGTVASWLLLCDQQPAGRSLSSQPARATAVTGASTGTAAGAATATAGFSGAIHTPLFLFSLLPNIFPKICSL